MLQTGPHASEFRRQMIELVRAGRDRADLARAFELSAQAIRNWIAWANRREGRQGAGGRWDLSGAMPAWPQLSMRSWHGFGARGVSPLWSATSYRRPQPGSSGLELRRRSRARYRPDLPVHEREPGLLPDRADGTRARRVEGRLS